MLTIENLSYSHPNKDLLFQGLHWSVNKLEKVALVGNNGVGKTTFLKIIAGELSPTIGTVSTDEAPYYIPQVFGQYNHLSIAQALQVEEKLTALHGILNGDASAENFQQLKEDWTIEERCQSALSYWGLENVQLFDKLNSLSGGQKTKVFLAGLLIHNPAFILLDEPTNHLDLSSRELLISYLHSVKSTVIVVSHDRKLLNSLNTTCELLADGIKTYGGNYEFYKAQKDIELEALSQEIRSKEKALKNAKATERDALERKKRQDARAKKYLSSAGLPKIVSNAWKGNAEKSAGKLAGVHAEKTSIIKEELSNLRANQPLEDQMKLDFESSALHTGKNIFLAENMNFSYPGEGPVWKENITLRILSGDRLVIKGDNGSGKTTLIKLILGVLKPTEGESLVASVKHVYIDQDYSLIKDDLTVLEQAMAYNVSSLLDHEVKTRLNRFLFSKDEWDKPCSYLSGGEKMRLVICCLNISNQAPDIMVLDEPTNNLDIQNIDILTNAVNDYLGTLIVVSHDAVFLESINISKTVEL